LELDLEAMKVLLNTLFFAGDCYGLRAILMFLFHFKKSTTTVESPFLATFEQEGVGPANTPLSLFSAGLPQTIQDKKGEGGGT
jgi:hypothetical protein